MQQETRISEDATAVGSLDIDARLAAPRGRVGSLPTRADSVAGLFFSARLDHRLYRVRHLTEAPRMEAQIEVDASMDRHPSTQEDPKSYNNYPLQNSGTHMEV